MSRRSCHALNRRAAQAEGGLAPQLQTYLLLLSGSMKRR